MGDVADRDPELAVGEEEDVATLLSRPAFGRVGRAVVVDASGSPVGLLSITDIQRTLRAARLGNGSVRSPKAPSKVSSG